MKIYRDDQIYMMSTLLSPNSIKKFNLELGGLTGKILRKKILCI